MHVNRLPAFPTAAAQAHFVVGISHKIGLEDVAFDDVRYVIRRYAYNVFALLGDGEGQLEHCRNLFQHTVYLRVEVVMVVDYAQMGVPGPCLNNLPVEQTGSLYAFGAHLITCSIVVLFGTVGS